MKPSYSTLPELQRGGVNPSFQKAMTLLGQAGVILLFLPFASDESPISALIKRDYFIHFWRVALPFFLAVLISVASIRQIIARGLTPLESALGYLASLGVACLTLSLFIQDLKPASTRDWISMAAAPVTLLAGGLIVFRNWRNGLPDALNALVSIQVSYLANCFMCLIAFFGEWQAGAYSALLTALVYLTQIAVISRADGNPRVRCHTGA